MREPDPIQNREEWLSLIHERKNPFYRCPEPSAKIWRYMDLAKFISLLHTKSLFFSISDLLGDPYEGAVSARNHELRRSQIERIYDDIRERDPDINLSELQASDPRPDFLKWSRLWTFVNCWNVSKHESAAMWSLYAGSDKSIAVQSTFQRLFDCLQPHRIPPMGEPLLGLVSYVDYTEDIVGENVHLSTFFYKRKSFEHEKEVIAVAQELPNCQKELIAGKPLVVNLDMLVEHIYVAPQAHGWFYDVVNSVLAKYDLKKSPLQSRLDGTPLY